MTFPYSEQNAKSRQRLEAFVRGLSDQDLARSTDYGWTVAALLAHLAFWDQRMIMILRRWQQEGLSPSPMDTGVVNDSLRVLCQALEPRTAVELCLSSAEAVDAELDTLTADFVKKLEEYAAVTETQFRMNRSLHRDSHLNDIAALLGR